MKKSLGIVLMVFLVLFSFGSFSLVGAVEQQSAGYLVQTMDESYYFAPALGVGSFNWLQYVAFQNLGDTGYATRLCIYCYVEAGSGCDVVVRALVGSISGTYGTDAYPNTVLAYSNNITLSGLSTGNRWLNFTFPAGGAELGATELYFVGVEAVSGSTYGVGGQFKWFGPTDNLYAGNSGRYPADTNVLATSIYDRDFIVYLDADYEATPTPSPVPVTVSVNNVGVQSVPSYYMIILVLFAVVAVLAGIYVGFERDGGNKGVAFLFALVALVIFVVLIVGYLAG